MINRCLIYTLVVLLFLTGCCGLSYKNLEDLVSSNQTSGVGNLLPTQPEWTYIVYMDGNNNIEQDAISDFLEMERGGGSTNNVNVVVQMARGGYYAGEGGWTGARRFLVGAGNGQNMTSPILEDIGNPDMGSPDTLYNFVSWAVDRYPAKKYAVVIWNHGGGWTGMLQDDVHNTSMSLGEMRQAFTNINQKLGRKMDVIVFDMCLMGQYDVMLDTYQYADYMVASEESVPGYSYDYTTVIGGLTSKPAMSPRDLAAMEVEKFREFYQDKEYATTMSAYDLSKFPQLKQAFDAFAEALTAHVKNGGWKDVAEMHQYADHYPLGSDEERIFSFGDLYDFASNGIAYSFNDSDLGDTAMALQTAINSTVIADYNHPKHARSYGVSYYFQPAKWIYSKINADSYPQTTAYNQQAWRDFLAAYYAKENMNSTKPVISNFEVSPVASLVRPIRFSYSMFGSNIVKNQWLQFYYENGEWKLARIISQRAVTTLANGKTVYGISDGASEGVGRSSTVEMRLTDGTRSDRVTVDKRWPAEDFFVVGGVYQRGNEKADAQLYFYESNGSIANVQITVQGPDGQPVVGYLPSLEDGDVFTPYIYKLAQTGLVQAESQPLTYNTGAGFELEWHLLEPGTYMVADMLTDLVNQNSYVVGTLKVGQQPTLTPLTQDDLNRNWECGQIEEGITVQYRADFNFSGGKCVMSDGLGVSECELTYSDKAIPHMHVYMKDRFETLHFIASRVNDNAMWLFELAGTDPIYCITSGSTPPSISVYKNLYASVGDNGEDLDERQVDSEGMRGSWESPANQMALTFNDDGTFRWTISTHAINGRYSVNKTYIALNAVSPSPEYSTTFYYLRGKHKLVLYDNSNKAIVFNRPGETIPEASNAPAPAVAPGTAPSQPQQQPVQPQAPPNQLVGQWYNPYTQTLLTLGADGYYTLLDGPNYYYGMYTVQGNILTLSYAGMTFQYYYQLSGNTLTLQGQGITIALTKTA
ncbi:MAG: clostripain-related cysteine peptidase [Candidatus Micrarchaeota archaeon]|nr:clostripain-related cysteine peptidase [Candidatus Micrarchaeota archaeon]